MKTMVFIGMLSIALCGCSYVQVLYTSPSTNNIKENSNGNYVYEDDAVRLTYTFWAEKGIMSFVIENKLNVPVYIDWKKSSFIDKKVKEDYYANVTTTNATAMLTDAGNIYYNSTQEKAERIVFIPPHSQIQRFQFALIPNVGHIQMKGLSKKEEVEIGNKKSKVDALSTDKNNSQIFFTNFITYSTSEKFDKEQYVENGFYVSKVVQVQEKNRDSYQDAKRFYLQSENRY